MAKHEKKRLSNVIRATEYLFLENIARKLVLEYRTVPNWQPLLDKLVADKEIMAGIRLQFRDIYPALEKAGDPSFALEAFLEGLPKQKKAH